LTKIFQSFYLKDGGKKSTGIDMEQNYVSVTVCIGLLFRVTAGINGVRVRIRGEVTALKPARAEQVRRPE